MAPSSGLGDPVARLVVGYLLDRVRDVEGADPALLDRALELYQLVESGGEGGARGHLDALRESTTLRGLAALLGGRTKRLAEIGLRLATDNRELMRALRERFAARGLDPADPARQAEAVAEYERLLAATVSRERSLENVAAIADTIDLANDVLNPRSVLLRGLLPGAIQALLPSVVKEPEVRRRVEELRGELTGQPERLTALARVVREAGPGIVHAAYERAGAPAGSVVASDDRRTRE